MGLESQSSSGQKPNPILRPQPATTEFEVTGHVVDAIAADVADPARTDYRRFRARAAEPEGRGVHPSHGIEGSPTQYRDGHEPAGGPKDVRRHAGKDVDRYRVGYVARVTNHVAVQVVLAEIRDARAVVRTVSNPVTVDVRIASVPSSIAIEVSLVRICGSRAVVDGIGDAVAIVIRVASVPRPIPIQVGLVRIGAA